MFREARIITICSMLVSAIISTQSHVIMSLYAEMD